MKTKNQYHGFNLNDYILVEITAYGWDQLKKYEEASGNNGFVKHCIINHKEIVDGKDYYKLQAHFVITTFGEMTFATYPAPIGINILIPKTQ